MEGGTNVQQEKRKLLRKDQENFSPGELGHTPERNTPYFLYEKSGRRRKPVQKMDVVVVGGS